MGNYHYIPNLGVIMLKLAHAERLPVYFWENVTLFRPCLLMFQCADADPAMEPHPTLQGKKLAYLVTAPAEGVPHITYHTEQCFVR